MGNPNKGLKGLSLAIGLKEVSNGWIISLGDRGYGEVWSKNFVANNNTEMKEITLRETSREIEEFLNGSTSKEKD